MDGDTFIHLGSDKMESVEAGELVYADGYGDKVNVLQAMELLANLLENHFNCTTRKFFVDKDNNEVEI